MRHGPFMCAVRSTDLPSRLSTILDLLQAAAQFLLDDWAPDSAEWYDESTGTWHYDPYESDEDRITGLKDIQGADMVMQCLSNAQGALFHRVCRLRACIAL